MDNLVSKKRILAIIPARGGSVEIPMKNITKINKKPLLFYTINAAINSKFIDRVIVSTDDFKIEEIAKKYGAQVIIRPKRISGNRIGLEPAIQHVLTTLKHKEKFVPDILVILQNTSPLRNFKHVDNSINLLLKDNFDSVISGFNSKYLVWRKEKNQIVPINYSPKKRPNRQEMKEYFIENGAIYVTKLSAFIKSKNRISGRTGIYVMPEKLSLQIDTNFDIFLAEKILKEIQNDKL